MHLVLDGGEDGVVRDDSGVRSGINTWIRKLDNSRILNPEISKPQIGHRPTCPPDEQLQARFTARALGSPLQSEIVSLLPPPARFRPSLNPAALLLEGKPFLRRGSRIVQFEVSKYQGLKCGIRSIVRFSDFFLLLCKATYPPLTSFYGFSRPACL